MVIGTNPDYSKGVEIYLGEKIGKRDGLFFTQKVNFPKQSNLFLLPFSKAQKEDYWSVYSFAP